jgi:hypothetical protein
LESPEAPWDVISVDFIVELPESHGYDTIMNVIDSVTKRMLIIQTPHKPWNTPRTSIIQRLRNERVSPKVPPTTYVGRRVKGRRSEGVEWIITK